MAPRALLLLVLLAPLGCTLPQRPAELPPRSEGYVAVLSGEMPGAISQVARHSWIVANVPGERSYRRYELGGGGGGDPFSYFGSGDVAVHGVVRYEPAKLDAVTRCLEVEELKYHREHPQYFPIPGPNSNTIVDVMLRRCGIHVELAATAIGRDYRGPIGVSVTSLGTGLQLETWIVGLKLGLEEGVELHVADLALGVHFWPPGITVPVNPGRIGFDATMHRKPSETESGRFGEREDNPDRKYGVSSIWMWSRATRVGHPEEVSGLAETAMVGLGARAAYGKTIGYGFGAEFEAGAAFPLGFAYAFRFYPTGIAAMFGHNSFFGAFAGIGADGVTSHVPGAFEIPAELRMEIDLTRRARVGARAAVAWFPANADRRGGSMLSPVADELTLSTFARFGRSPPCGCSVRDGRGYFFALERREILHTYWLGFTFGVEVDFGG
jgi:hypothetical protein